MANVKVSLLLAGLLVSSGSVSANTLPLWSVADGDSFLGGKAALEEDYLKIYPNTWHNGWVEVDTKLGNRPNLGVYTALSFQAKAIGFSGDCEPSLNFYGGAYPRRYSHTIVLKDGYVQEGQLLDSEYRQVVVPVADLKTDTFPLDQIQNLNFLKCSSGSGYTYRIQNIEMTDNPPEIGNPSTSVSSGSVLEYTLPLWSVADGDSFLGGRAAIEEDYLKIYPSTWHNGWVEIDTKFGNRPDLGVYAALLFQAKAIGFSGDCEPSLNFYGGAYPRRYSHTIVLKDGYVQGGQLVDSEYRQVVVPVADLKTDTFPLDQIQNLNFLKCSSGSGYTYRIQNIGMTDNPPQLGNPSTPGTDSPSKAPVASPSEFPSGVPTKAPSDVPTKSPTSAPTTPPELKLWSGLADGNSPEGPSCLFFNDRGITTQETQDGIEQMLVQPDSWRSGGLHLGCLATDNGVCVHTCFDEGSRPDLSPYAALSFKAKIDNEAQLESGCQPRVKLYGGGSPAMESEIAVLSGSFVDTGSLASDEWRQVVIPVSDLQNTWDLNGPKTLRFLTCGSDFSTQPVYRITDIRFTDDPPELITQAPTSSPTVRVTESPSMATHIKYHKDWFPIVKSSVGNWLVAENGQWPDVPASEQDYSILVPEGSNVVYSTESTVKLDKVVIERGGSLEISDQTSSAVSMTLSTLRVEEGGALTIQTTGSSSSIDIQFDGSVDKASDPTELMNGLVSLGGTVLIQGRERCSKMEEIVSAPSGSNTLVVKGQSALQCWGIGDELIFPDTQNGLEMGHWDFSHVYNPSVAQTESLSILAMEESGTDTLITLDANLQHSHREGAHVAMVSRSIVLRTSVDSASRGHILHTGVGAFDVRNARISHMGRTSTAEIDNTSIEDSGVPLAEGLANMQISHSGTNQLARYALHAHHSLVPMEFSGNVVVGGLRFGLVAHNSRVAIRENIVFGVEGSGILLEDGTETGDVTNNFLIGTGGSGEGDGLRFTPSEGMDFGFGGFGIWSRTAYSKIEGNVAEGVFGEAPYAFFLHINFMKDRQVPNVEGTPANLIGNTRPEVRYDVHDGALTLNTYGSFKDNSCLGSWVAAFSSTYAFGTTAATGHILENFNAVALAKEGSGLSFTHSSTFTLSGGSVTAVEEGNSIVGVTCGNDEVITQESNLSYLGVSEQTIGCSSPSERKYMRRRN